VAVPALGTPTVSWGCILNTQPYISRINVISQQTFQAVMYSVFRWGMHRTCVRTVPKRHTEATSQLVRGISTIYFGIPIYV